MMVPLILTLALGFGLVVVVVAVVRYRKVGTRMELREFFLRLIRARGVGTISARRLHDRLESEAPPLLIDLRDPKHAAAPFHEAAVHVPFDDFLRQVVVEERFAEHRDRPVVLVCDHGNLSRIAGDVLAEDLGFSDVHSLRGGTWAWERHLRAVQRGRCCTGARSFPARQQNR